MLIKSTIHFSSSLKMCISVCNFTAVISKRAIKVGKRRFSVTKRESADAITTTK